MSRSLSPETSRSIILAGTTRVEIMVKHPKTAFPCPCPKTAAVICYVVKMDTVGSRVTPLTDEDDLWKRHFASAQMVIEAVPENLDLKHRSAV